MKEDDVEKLIDNQRWLMNNGLSNDLLKDQLFLFGSIVHKDITAVEVDIRFQDKVVEYRLFGSSELLKKINKFNKLSTSDSIFGLWRFKRLLKKEGNLNFQSIVGRFVKDFLGPKWKTEAQIVNVKEYLENDTDEERSLENASEGK